MQRDAVVALELLRVVHVQHRGATLAAEEALEQRRVDLAAGALQNPIAQVDASADRGIVELVQARVPGAMEREVEKLRALGADEMALLAASSSSPRTSTAGTCSAWPALLSQRTRAATRTPS